MIKYTKFFEEEKKFIKLKNSILEGKPVETVNGLTELDFYCYDKYGPDHFELLENWIIVTDGEKILEIRENY